MGTFREPDALSTLLLREQARLLESLQEFASGAGASALVEARRVLHALADVETNVLYPVFSRVHLRPETERLLEDYRDARAQQLAAVDALAHKRSSRLRKLAMVELADIIQHHGRQHVSLLIPVLASQLPRPMYRSIVHAVTARYQEHFEAPAKNVAKMKQTSPGRNPVASGS
jgi:hypothetical protein